jgi:mannose/fructose/N-acetylgalactosamine-specific phosphotransferase system component IIC
VSYLALAVVAGLAAVERKGFLQAMLSRPIALGAITGAVLGDAATGLYVGVPLELLWLGAINMGAALPVHEALGTAAAAGAAVLASRALAGSGADGPALLPAISALSVAACVPLASLGRRADRAVEQWNEHLYLRAEQDLAHGDAAAAARVNLHGLAWPFAIAFVLAPVGAAVASALIPPLLLRAPAAAAPLAVGWFAFSGLACAAGAKAMRSLRAPAFYFAALVLGVALAGAVAIAGVAR